jgi:hypothetical protein
MPSLSWDRTKLLELTVEGKRYVIAGGEYREKTRFRRRTARLEKAERELKRSAALRRKKPNPQKLASQVGRKLEQGPWWGTAPIGTQRTRLCH